MSRKRLRYSFTEIIRHFICLSVLSFFTSCAPKVAAPPIYLHEELSRDEIIMKARDDINTLKAISAITIEKDLQMIDQVSASLLMKGPDRLHIKIYKFGMLVHDVVMKDGELYNAKGKSSSKFIGLISEFARAVFWWDSMKSGSITSDRTSYFIRTDQKEIQLDRATLLPMKQNIISSGKIISILYAEPKDYEGFWQPSQLTIGMDDLKFTIKIEKLIKNPPATETDFAVPQT